MQDLDARKKRLDVYFKRIQEGDVADEIRSDLAKFGAVQICGFVERSVEIIVLDRLTGRAHPRVTNFIKGHFKRGTNYDCEAICQLLGRFDTQWEANFREYLRKNDNVVSGMKSAYTLRNAIAHGGEANRGVAGVMQLYVDAKSTVNALFNCPQT